ncbi:hypothetical protein IMZ48_30815 [Candidatus Bathyarchaeota archaeon]|nr:hypothetical protein [Candidatus Bathyarchaeota archaeon]
MFIRLGEGSFFKLVVDQPRDQVIKLSSANRFGSRVLDQCLLHASDTLKDVERSQASLKSLASPG